MIDADALIRTDQIGYAPLRASIVSRPVLDSRRRDIQGSRGLANAAERVDHGDYIDHGTGMYDNRIGRQAVSYDFATSGHCTDIVQGVMDDLDRILAAYDTNRHSRAELAAALRVSVPSVGRLLRRERRLTAIERQAAFSYLGLEDVAPPLLRTIPVIGMIAAGQWSDAIQQPVGETFTSRGGKRSFALRIEGDSMDQIAPPGASVVIDPDDRDLREGRSYAIIRDDGTATFKRYRAEPARLEPVSSNPAHRPIQVGSEPFVVIGRAIEVTQEL